MRPLRLLLSLLSCVVAITLLLYITVPTHSADASTNPDSPKKKGRLRALFSFSAPSLFPPSAIISLTDDNSTFFLARPAAFGPGLPNKGLSGQLWTGSGFGGDSLSHGGLTTGAEGELGCSDVPGWEDRRRAGKTPDLDLSIKKAAKPGDDPKKQNKRGATAAEGGASDVKTDSLLQDGTDDHFQDASDFSWASSRARNALDQGKATEHADIQSLQESAEIAGKVVLLSRGGCGFLEKVKWAQRRGGVAVIVGDDIRGGPLVTMYAKGDTSNITIPALFTSHTTAHLLSSLVPSGGSVDDSPHDESLKLGIKTNKDQKGYDKSHVAGPTFTHGVTGSRPTSAANSAKTPARPSREESHVDEVRPSWIRSLLTLFSSSRNKDLSKSDSRRPPSSGNIDWILVEDWDEEEPKKTKSNTKTPKVPTTPNRTKPTATKAASRPADNFVIGVQDWRDPDLLPQQTDPAKNSKDQSSPKPKPGESKPKGGSTLPGSGEYYGKNNGKEGNWFDKLPWGKQPGASPAKPSATVTQKPTSTSVRPALKPSQFAAQSHTPGSGHDGGPHEGLWVTLTPTSMSNSPFFDTLVVLVVSPLVTLTVVYALLLLRSRIRRRRWRAPKSVVERLPVRTYHTLNSDDSNSSNSPVATPAAGSPRTPLLQQATSSGSSRSRPRSRTAGSRSRSADAEKDTSGLAAWRRKYGGRQKECVVCLEEYVDGVSRVMSLPCGHEFHVECITPWLTTRRRTCPICKGDVVRSLASSPSSSRRHHRPSRHPHSSTATAIPSSAPTSTHGPNSPFYLSTAGASAPAATSTGPSARRPPSTSSSSPDPALYETATSSLPSQSAIASARNDSPSAARPLSVRSQEVDDPFIDDVYRRGRRRGGGDADELDLDLERGSTAERRGLMHEMDDVDDDSDDGDEGGVVSWARDGWSEVRSWAGGFLSGGSSGRGRRAAGSGSETTQTQPRRAYDSDGEYIDRDR
ncbi:PA and RING finger domain-containing protein [Phyllosticta capitalensis]|uniref:RING-type E3 ubiquitin transferase n=1 Tax=Phyllosticta capitalensis TaxID=121624 RepID=A0ABR1YI93_9PEZI